MQVEGARRLTLFHRTLYRPQQVQGGERELMSLSMLVAGGLIVSAMNQSATIPGTCIWLVCIYGLRKMTRADPDMSKVYVRRPRYRNYYGPFPRPHRVVKSSRIY